MNQLERELFQYATGMAGLCGEEEVDGLDGLFSKIFKMAGPILPIAGAALAPFTGGASLLAAGAISAIGNSVAAQNAARDQQAQQAQAMSVPLALPPAPAAPLALLAPAGTPPPVGQFPQQPSALGMDTKTMLMIGAGALVLVLLISRK